MSASSPSRIAVVVSLIALSTLLVLALTRSAGADSASSTVLATPAASATPAGTPTIATQVEPIEPDKAGSPGVDETRHATPSTTPTTTSKTSATPNGQRPPAMPLDSILGSLSLKSVSAVSPSSISLNGTDQDAHYTLSAEVSDTRALGILLQGGWNLQISSTRFTVEEATAKQLASDASTISGVTATMIPNCESILHLSLCIMPTNVGPDSIVIPTDAGATSKIFFAANFLTGVGEFTITAPVTVAIPATAYAGTYVSTLIITLNSGP